MNIILNTPLPSTANSRKDYDNTILYLFLSLFSILIILGVFFVDMTSRNLF